MYFFEIINLYKFDKQYLKIYQLILLYIIQINHT